MSTLEGSTWSLGSHVWLDCTQMTFFRVSHRPSTRGPSSYRQFGIICLDQGFVHPTSTTLPPASHSANKHTVCSFVPTLQHQPLAHRTFCLLGILFRHLLPNGFWENLTSRWRRVKWLQLLGERPRCQQNTPGAWWACQFFPGTAAG